MAFWLWNRLGQIPAQDAFGIWIRVLMAANLVSLLLSEHARFWKSPLLIEVGRVQKGAALPLPQRIGNQSLTSLQQRLVKTGGRLIKHARY